jgi:hypothetical protein
MPESNESSEYPQEIRTAVMPKQPARKMPVSCAHPLRNVSVTAIASIQQLLRIAQNGERLQCNQQPGDEE